MDLYGRDAELDDIADRLAERRLVTIVGAGGIGKTSLAREAARRLGPSYPIGAIHVDLTRVDRDEAVAEALAGQLGFADFQSFVDSPGDQPALLVIDNCEHVLEAAAWVVDHILGACEMPRVLATSRTALDLDGESILPLAPLSTPQERPAEVAGAGVESASLQLFVARARDHGVVIGDVDRSVAAEICRRLDGVPLAIELAAARLRTVGVADVLTELEEAPHALARRRHRGQASHRSVGDLVAWSYELLDPAEQEVFRRLGVFAGPFTRELARRVVATDEHGADRVDASIDGLIDASLVVVDRANEATRYRLLHPVRAVAMNLLEGAGEADECRSRLVDAICGHSIAIVRGGPQGWDPADLHGLLGLYDHAASSIRWLLDHDDEPERALTLVAVLWGIVHNAHSAEIHELGEAVLRRWPDREAQRWPHAAATVSTCRFLAGDTDGAIELAASTLPFADRSRAAPSLLRRVIAQSRRAAGDIEGCRDTFREAADIAEERGAMGLYYELRVDEGLAMVECGDLDGGLAEIERMIEEAADAGAPINVVWAKAARASVLRRRDAASAVAVIEATLGEARAIDYPAGVTFALRLLAAAKIELGEVAEPARALVELLDSLLQRGGLDEMRVVLDLAAELMRREGLSGWETLAATAAEFPITSFMTPTELAFLPAERPAVEPLSTRDGYVLARTSLLALAGGSAAAASTDGEPAMTDDSEPGSSDGASMVSEGDVWRLSFEGQTIRLKRSKGLDDLATLLSAPGRDVTAVDLAGSVTAAVEDEILDPAARREYEERIRDLQIDLAEADDHHDTARSELLQAELDALVEQLASAVGLGGRSRRTAGTAERARSAVTQRIRSTIKRIDGLHADLGAHLDQSVSTGVLCRYDPRPTVAWTVRRSVDERV